MNLEEKMLFSLSIADAATILSWIEPITVDGVAEADAPVFWRLEKSLQNPLSATQHYQSEITTLKSKLENRELEIESLVSILNDAKLQIEYLHGKFKETGSGNAVLGKIDNVLKDRPTAIIFTPTPTCEMCGKQDIKERAGYIWYVSIVGTIRLNNQLYLTSKQKDNGKYLD